jgi:hypothetical protein
MRGLSVVPVTLSGPKKVTVGGVVVGLPKVAGVRLAQRGQLAYVAYEGKLHCLTAHGEILIPKAVRDALSRRYFR